jgi:hypothetical protein
VAFVQQGLGQVGSDEAGATGDQNAHGPTLDAPPEPAICSIGLAVPVPRIIKLLEPPLENWGLTPQFNCVEHSICTKGLALCPFPANHRTVGDSTQVN